MKRNLVTAFAAIAGSQVIILLGQTLFSPFLVRLLGPATYGEYATLVSAFGLLMILVSSGINGGVRKFIAEERSDDLWKSDVFAYYFRLALIFAIIAAGLLVLAAEFGVVSAIFEPKYVPYFYLLALLVLASQFREYVRRAIMGLKLEGVGSMLNVVYKISYQILALGLLLIGFKVEGVLGAQIISSMVVFVLGIVYVSKTLSLKEILRPTPVDFPRKKLFYFNHNSVIYFFLLNSLYKIDVLMLGSFTNSELTGYYNAALVLAEILWLLPTSLQGLMIQSTSDHWAKGRVQQIEEIATRSIRYVALLMLLLAIGLGSLAEVFVPWYFGVEMKPATTPLIILLPGVVGFAVARPLLTINQAKGDMRVLIAATGISAAINLVLNYLLIPYYGMVGAAVSTSIGYGSLPLLQMWAARTLGYKPFRRARLGRITATAVLSASVIVFLSLSIGSTKVSDLGLTGLSLLGEFPIALLIVPLAGFLLYSLIAISTGAIDLGEIFEILVKVPGISGHVKPIQEKFEKSNRFGNDQSRESAMKLIIAIALVIALVIAAVSVAGFPILSMTPLGSTDSGVLGSFVEQNPSPPSSGPADSGTLQSPTDTTTPPPTDGSPTPDETVPSTPTETSTPPPTEPGTSTTTSQTPSATPSESPSPVETTQESATPTTTVTTTATPTLTDVGTDGESQLLIGAVF